MDPAVTEGQVGNGPEAATETTPEANSGQPLEGNQTTDIGAENQQQLESFFDPKSIEHSPELMQAYKQMQGAFTKKTQGIKQNQSKIEAYDAFNSNPVGTLQQLAQQYGFQLVQPGAAQQSEEEWQPQTWDDVLNKSKTDARNEVLKELEPLIDEVKSMKQLNTETYLDNHYSDWRVYEDQMLGLLKSHPTLATDPDTLYRMAVPNEVIEARAMKAALAKGQTQSENAQISGGGNVKKTTSQKLQVNSFNDAVNLAKAKLQKQGIKP